MTGSPSDAEFVGSIPRLYESLLVPMIFDEPARSLASSIAALHPKDILGVGCGTGVLTGNSSRSVRTIVATDLDPAMIDSAKELLADDRVHWQVADAMDLPFGDETFDVVACQFGVMFFPSRSTVLPRPRGCSARAGRSSSTCGTGSTPTQWLTW